MANPNFTKVDCAVPKSESFLAQSPSLPHARQSIPMEGDTLIIFRPLIFGTFAYGPRKVRSAPLSCRIMTSPATLKTMNQIFLPTLD